MENNAITTTNTTTAIQKKRGGGAMQLVRVALFMIKGKSSFKTASAIGPPRPAGRSLWRDLVSSMRPLHHNHTPPPPALTAPPSSSSKAETLTPPVTPHALHDNMSRYASAEDLRELDKGGDDLDVGNNSGGFPNSIDVKAEEFIASFYEQMRLQRLDSVQCHNLMVVGGAD
ncbi:hypothetical protein QJS10_CPA05g00284 [Acorus calamus]|uniref:Uncharacterized protein n=1 Tax=Acorus calamus TaxID=4465 RepID=A0AAV9F0T1_ACOCL|nr:hypothetical protein QJS10_CPA05g00284 [Acorus calamus]